MDHVNAPVSLIIIVWLVIEPVKQVVVHPSIRAKHMTAKIAKIAPKIPKTAIWVSELGNAE